MRNTRCCLILTTLALLLWLLPFGWAQQYTISTVARIGTLPSGGEVARADSAFLVAPRVVAADSAGDQNYNQIFRISTSGYFRPIFVLGSLTIWIEMGYTIWPVRFHSGSAVGGGGRVGGCLWSVRHGVRAAQSALRRQRGR